MSFTERVQKDFTTITLALIPLAIVINIVVGQLIVILKLPVYLDSIGTVLVGALAGPLAGALTGLLSNIIWPIVTGNPTILPYAIVAGVIGLLAGFFGSRGVFKSILWTVIAGLVTGAIAAIISAPITVYVNGGVTGSGTDVIVAAAQQVGATLLQAATIQGFISDPLDKTISYLVVWVILHGMSKRLLSQFPRGGTVLGEEPIQEASA